MPLGAKTDALHQYRFHFLCVSPPIDHQVSGIFQFSIDPIFETCVVQTHKHDKNNMCSLGRADQCFINEVQILCSSKTLNYENFTIANMNMNMYVNS